MLDFAVMHAKAAIKKSNGKDGPKKLNILFPVLF